MPNIQLKVSYRHILFALMTVVYSNLYHERKWEKYQFNITCTEKVYFTNIKIYKLDNKYILSSTAKNYRLFNIYFVNTMKRL